MANWALVENDKIVQTLDNLPDTWKNVSGLNKSSDDIGFLASLGWLYIEKQHQSFNSNTHEVASYHHEYINGKVIETIQLREKQEVQIVQSPDPVSFSSPEPRFLQKIRQKRNELLQASDWTQLTDVQSSMTDEEKYRWNQYRQDLRDFPEQYQNSGRSGVDFNRIVWPDHRSYVWPPAVASQDINPIVTE